MTPRKKRQRYRRSAAIIATKHGLKIDLEDWIQIWELLDQYAEPEYLYVMGNTRSGLVKIGKSKCPRTRLSNVQTGNDDKLSLWCYCPHESPFTEKEVHKKLAGVRVTGEWFRLTEEVQTLINEVRAAAR